jgi:hypothetical protein
METILLVPGELEHLESLVKLARRRRDSETNESPVLMVSAGLEAGMHQQKPSE